MLTGAVKHVINVRGKDYEVSVYQKSKTVWRATGTYEGQRIEVQDRSEQSALARWRGAATYRDRG